MMAVRQMCQVFVVAVIGFQYQDCLATRTRISTSSGGPYARASEKCGADAKVVYFIRHAEGYHQLYHEACRENRDPRLTRAGRGQAQSLPSNPVLADALSGSDTERAQLVIASPLVRTMETAVLGSNASLP